MSAGDDGGTKAEEVGPGDVGVKENGVTGTQEEYRAPQGKEDAAKTLPPDADDFGLPTRPPRRRQWSEDEDEDDKEVFVDCDGGENADIDVANGTTKNCRQIAEEPNVDSTKAVRTDQGQSHPTSDGKVENDESKAVIESPKDIESATNRERAATLDDIADRSADSANNDTRPSSGYSKQRSRDNTVSEWSHQQLAPRESIEEEVENEGEWQEMPALATHRIYDDWNKVIAKSYDEVDDMQVGYASLGGAGKGYTRVQVDDDALSATSMDDDTAYLFKQPHQSNTLVDDEEEGRDVVTQMQATKELLTEGQRIAYVGLVRLSIGKMLAEFTPLEHTRRTKKPIELALESTKMWGQKTMVRLYSHMDIDSAEQLMVEQLADHGVLPQDLTPVLMQNARVKNPVMKDVKDKSETSSITSSARPSLGSPRPSSSTEKKQSRPTTPGLPDAPPAYEEMAAEELTVQDPSEFENKQNLDLDIRWTVLCDLFLLLLAESTYDARSRTLLEHVALCLSVDWQEVCRFEKRVTDALEMQEEADKENWNEDDHLEHRRKAARNRRLVVMGLCTVGGGLVIGLSAGLLAPLIGAGLAAGLSGIGVAGTGTFLGGTGAAALIGSGGALTGGIVGVRASNRRTGAVKTFEYRPLFNNKRPNLIVTVSGWMTGKVDDVRLPYSTVDPIMGDVYSVHWEPEMLQSTGQTIQILATEALTQTIQQILGSTILIPLMAGLSVPIVLTKLSYLIDNPWTVSLARADAAGLILADSLIERNLGVRPITLVGFSLGSRVIFSCLKELARRGAVGLVQNVYLFGSPIVANKDDYTRARTIVSGRFVNGYATKDWILGYLFRATSGGLMRVAGLNTVDVPGIENKDCTEIVPGHMAYRNKMPALLEASGWLVDGLEFNEIEDPDPENHQKRQRELINEIEAARHELEEKEKGEEKKTGFKAFFQRNKKAALKKEWETYDERTQKVLEGDEKAGEELTEQNMGVMFDVDAIRQEALKLAVQEGVDLDDIKAHLQIREIESTLPALKVSSPNLNVGNKESNEYDAPLRQTKSLDERRTIEPSGSGRLVNGDASHLHEREEEQVSLSFEAEERPANLSSSNLSTTSEDNSAPERPPIRSAATSLAIGSHHTPPIIQYSPPAEIKRPDHNPWGDEDDEFGAEKEVSMSFE